MKKLATILMLLIAPFALVGCETDVAEYETPSGEEVEIERDLSTGELEAEVD